MAEEGRAEEGRPTGATVLLAVAVATLVAVAIGTWILRGDIRKAMPPAEMKGTFCCEKVDGRTGTDCEKIGDDDESQERCRGKNKDVLQCMGSHSHTSSGTATCL